MPPICLEFAQIVSSAASTTVSNPRGRPVFFRLFGLMWIRPGAYGCSLSSPVAFGSTDTLCALVLNDIPHFYSYAFPNIFRKMYVHTMFLSGALPSLPVALQFVSPISLSYNPICIPSSFLSISDNLRPPVANNRLFSLDPTVPISRLVRGLCAFWIASGRLAALVDITDILCLSLSGGSFAYNVP